MHLPDPTTTARIVALEDELSRVKAARNAAIEREKEAATMLAGLVEALRWRPASDLPADGLPADGREVEFQTAHGARYVGLFSLQGHDGHQWHTVRGWYCTSRVVFWRPLTPGPDAKARGGA